MPWDLVSCVSLQNVLRKVQHQDALQISDVVMASLLRMFQSTAGSGGVQEDALMAVSTLVEGKCEHTHTHELCVCVSQRLNCLCVAVLGSDFQKYMDAFKPFLAIGLKNYAEYQVATPPTCCSRVTPSTPCFGARVKWLLRVCRCVWRRWVWCVTCAEL